MRAEPGSRSRASAWAGGACTSCAAAKDLKTRAHTGVQDTVQKLLNGTNHVVTTASEYQLYGFPKHNLTARDAKPDLIITREGQPQGSAHTFDVGITRPGQHVPRAALTTPGVPTLPLVGLGRECGMNESYE